MHPVSAAGASAGPSRAAAGTIVRMGRTTRIAGRPGLWSGSLFRVHGGPWMAEKIENVKLWRALARTGIGEGDDDGLPRSIAMFGSHDATINGVLATLRRRRHMPETSLDTLNRVLEYGPEIRALVLDSLSKQRRDAAVDWISDMPVGEEEVWMELDAARYPSETRPSEGPFSLVWDLERTFRAQSTAKRRRHRDVVRIEARPLPRASGLEPWLERLPARWLRVIGRLHGVAGPGRARGRDIARAVAARLRKRGVLGSILREQMGQIERLLFAMVADRGQVPLSRMDDEVREAFDAGDRWDVVPPVPGGRLRAFGLVFVGRAKGSRWSRVPPSCASWPSPSRRPPSQRRPGRCDASEHRTPGLSRTAHASCPRRARGMASTTARPRPGRADGGSAGGRGAGRGGRGAR